MALVKIKNRREPIEVSLERGRKIKKLRFGDLDGHGKLDPFDDLDLGDEWAGSIGQIEWIDLGKTTQKKEYKVISKVGESTLFQVPLDYKLQDGEEFI